MRKTTTVAVMVMGLAMIAPGAAQGFDRDDLRDLAEKLDREAYRTLERADDRRIGNVDIRALQTLSYEADHFRYQIDRNYRDPYHTAEDFDVLAQAFHRAARLLDRRHPNDRVRKDFRKVAKAFGRLSSRYYARTGHRYATGRGSAAGSRYDRTGRGDYWDNQRNRPRGRVIVRPPRRRSQWRGRPRLHVNVGLPIPGGRVRVVWN